MSASTILTTGKHAGKTFEQMVKNEPGYIQWISTNISPQKMSKEFKELLQYVASCDPNTIAKIPAKSHKAWTETEKQKLLKMADEGIEVSLICKELGRSENAIQMMYNQLTTKSTSPPKTEATDIEYILQQLQEQKARILELEQKVSILCNAIYPNDTERND